MLSVRLAGDHLYIWEMLSLVMSMMVSFCAVDERSFSNEMSWMRSGT